MENSLRKDRLLLAQNYALYYGFGHADLLSRFDISIIEPKGQTTKEINHLRKWNTLVITYLSVVEVRPEEPIFQQLDDEDFLFLNGNRVINKEFGTYYVNLRSKKWIQHLLKATNDHFMILGSDGIFLDTIGNMDGLPKEVRNNQTRAIVNLLHVIKMLYPNHLLIQNNGLEYVCLQTAPYIDGICWENPPLVKQECQEWVNLIKKRLMVLKEKMNIKILLLIEETVDEERKGYIKARKMAKESGFLLYNAPNNYVHGVNVLRG